MQCVCKPINSKDKSLSKHNIQKNDKIDLYVVLRFDGCRPKILNALFSLYTKTLTKIPHLPDIKIEPGVLG